jgi:hypothetical protein
MNKILQENWNKTLLLLNRIEVKDCGKKKSYLYKSGGG